MNIQTKYKIGDIVFLITDIGQLPRMITGMLIRPSGVSFYLSNSITESHHYQTEFTRTQNVHCEN